ncbi:hypothetical protein KR044_009344 [Drosophila immigrans]|nr:hypothetical protein KR044_009344 [Drosophila immigrans]
MKFYVALISLLLCCTLILAQRNCPSICPAVFSPVCVEGNVRGRPVRCQFSNSCEMGASNCRKPISK